MIRPGLEHITALPADRVLKIIRTEAFHMGYSVETLRWDHASTCLRTRFRSFRYCLRAVFLRLPTDVIWEVRSRDKETTVYCDSKITGTYFWVLVTSCIVFIACYLRGINAVFGDWETASTLEVSAGGLLVAASLMLVFVNYALVLGGGIESLSTIVGNIRREAITAGSSLSEAGHGNSPRHIARTISYLTLCAFVLLIPVFGDMLGSETPERFPPVLLAFLGMLIVIVLVLLSCLLSILRNPGFGLRIVPGLSGGITAISVLILLCAQMPWVTVDRNLDTDGVAALLTAQAYLNNTGSVREPLHTDGTPATREEVVRVFGKIRFLAWAYWFGTMFLIVLAAWFFLSAIYCVLKGYQYVYQLSKRPDCVWSQRATQGGSFMTKFRITFGLVWLLLAVCLVLAATRTALTTSQWFMAQDPQHGPSSLNAIQVSVFFASIALNVPLQSAFLLSAVRAFWAIYLSTCWLLVVTSAGSFIVQRYGIFSRARNQAEAVPNGISSVNNKIASMWVSQCSRPVPIVVLYNNAFPIARVQRIGFLTGRTAIELSTGCLNMLAPDELNALLAHELSHCIAKHCNIDNLLRFLGRCSFVGDGFARMMQDTFGYEVRADQLALEAFGVRPDALT